MCSLLLSAEPGTLLLSVQLMIPERPDSRLVATSDWRREPFGTLVVQVFPLTDVKAYLGHADIATTMIYVHHVPRVDAAEKLSAALRDASTAEPASVVAA